MHLIEARTFLAERLPASTLAEILALDVVPGVAFRVIVMNGLLDGMPRSFSRHESLSFLTRGSGQIPKNPVHSTRSGRITPSGLVVSDLSEAPTRSP